MKASLATILIMELFFVRARGREIDDGVHALVAKRSLFEAAAASSEACRESENCQMCTYSDRKSISACKLTGRMQKFTCTSSSEDGEVIEKRTEIRSCDKTPSEEVFGLVRLQMLCLLIGSLAFASVRRQKRYSASLFDQRKQGMAQTPSKRGRRNSDMVDDEEIEFTQVTNQETLPLVDISSNPLEVI